jgi:arabinofuranosyltransferase
VTEAPTTTEAGPETGVAVGAPAPEQAPARPLRRVLYALPAYLPAAMIAVGGWAHRWTNEDAFINFRILDNLFAGDGLVFNAGERVEAGTSPLWLGLLSVGRLLFGWALSMEWISVVLCLVAAVAAFALAGRCARLAAPDADTAVVPIGPIMVASVAVVWDFATSGLEMSLVWLWIAACWYVLCRTAGDATWPVLSVAPKRSAGKRAAAAAVIGLAPLVRPDLGVMMVCFVGAWFVLVRPRRIVADLGAMFLLPLLYQVFRMGYYASVVPNTALAKDANGLHVHQGWNYLVDFVGPYRLWLPLLVILATVGVRLSAERQPRGRTATLAVLAAGAIHGAYIVVVGGDYMHGRLLLPAFFALGLPAWVILRGRILPALALSAVAGVWAVVAIVAFRPEPPPPGVPQIADWRQILGATVEPADVELVPTGILAKDIYDEGVRGYIRPLQPLPEPGRDPDALVVALGSIGVPAYQLGTQVWVVDIGGLAEPLAARTDPIPGRQAGHRKQVDDEWYIARFGVVTEDGPPPVQDAAEALECGPVQDLLDAVDEPLTPGRFLSNIWHSVGYTRLRIPADPHEAVAELCP